MNPKSSFCTNLSCQGLHVQHEETKVLMKKIEQCYISTSLAAPLFEKMQTNKQKIESSKTCHGRRYDPDSMNAWSRLWAACVSSGVPDITTVLSVVPGRASCSMTVARDI